MQHWLSLAAAGGLGPAQRLCDRDVLFSEHDPAAVSYLLTEGVIELLQTQPGRGMPVVRLLVAPAQLGAVEICGGEPDYLLTARAAGDACVHSIPKARVLGLLARDANLAAESVIDTSRSMSRFVRASPSSGASPKACLAALLLAYAEVFGKPASDGIRIGLERSAGDIALAVGARKTIIDALLSQWERRGSISFERSRVVIRDMQALHRRAGKLGRLLVHRYPAQYYRDPADWRMRSRE